MSSSTSTFTAHRTDGQPLHPHEDLIGHLLARQVHRKELRRKKPRCEVCGKKPAVSFSMFYPGYRWLFVCMCTAEDEHGPWVSIKDYCGSQKFRDDKDRHIGEKRAEYSESFFAAVARYVDAGGVLRQ